MINYVFFSLFGSYRELRNSILSIQEFILKNLILVFLYLSSSLVNANAKWETVSLDSTEYLSGVSFTGEFGWVYGNQDTLFISKDGGGTWGKKWNKGKPRLTFC